MAQREKQPASESLQKWLLFASTLIFSVLSTQSVLLLSLGGDMREVIAIAAENGRNIQRIEKRVDRLEGWRYSQPFRKPKVRQIPKVALPLDVRRRLHIEGPYHGSDARF